jgi:hypothetical protein
MVNKVKTWDTECLVQVLWVWWHNMTANTDFTVERAALFSLKSTSSGGKSGQQVQTDNHSEPPNLLGRLVVLTNLSVCCTVCSWAGLQLKRWQVQIALWNQAAMHIQPPPLFILTEYILPGSRGLVVLRGTIWNLCKQCTEMVHSAWAIRVREQCVTCWCNRGVFVQLLNTLTMLYKSFLKSFACEGVDTEHLTLHSFVFWR